MGLLGWIVVGLVAGLIARAIVPTGRHLGCLGTIVLGILGSVLGGTLASLLSDDGFGLARSGWIGSIVGAVLILLTARFVESE